MRDATLLKMLAAKAVAAGGTEKLYSGRKAILWLEQFDEATGDLNTMRLEMIQRILKLRELLKEGN